MGRRRHFLCPQRLFDNNVAGQRVVRGRQDRLPQFYIRRILRLWPPFAVFLFVVVLKISLSEGQKTASFEAVAVSAVYLMNWSRAFIWWEQYKLGHTWSLAMEEQFYLLWPALLAFIFTRRAIPCITGLIIVMVTWRCFLALNGADPERTYNGFDTHGDALLIGVCWRFLSGEIPIRQSN